MQNQQYFRLLPLLDFKPRLALSLTFLVGELAGAVAIASHPGTGWGGYIAGQVALALIAFHHFVLLHEAGHGNLSRRTSVNVLLGHYCSLFCAMPFYSWKFIHAEHHAWAGNLDHDPTLKGVRALRTGRPVWLVTFLEGSWRCGLPFLAVAQHLVLYTYPLGLRKSAEPTRWRKALFSVAFLLSAYAIAAYFFGTRLHLFGPAVLFYLVLTEVVNFPHHLGMPLFQGDAKLKVWEQAAVTRSCYYPGLLSVLVSLNFNYHIEHHLFPKLPWHQLRRARGLVKDALQAEYSEAPGLAWTITHRLRPFSRLTSPSADQETRRAA